jgi:Domain of unknown function (DUF4157)
MPMPWNIRQALQGWYPDNLLNKARFKVGDGGALNLANNSIRYGGAEAATLIDVIVFRGPSEASRPDLWAHEMKHIEQFDTWGVHSFAVQYMRSWNSVENPAYAIQAEYARQPGPRYQYSQYAPPAQYQTPQAQYRALPAQYPAPQSQYPQYAQQVGAQRCVTQIGWCPLRVPMIRGYQCGCAGPAGFVPGISQ